MGMMFVEYTKINTVWKRTTKGIIIPGDFSVPEFEFLAHNPWNWTEKIDGMNLQLHWDGSSVYVGGRTANAQIPAKLYTALKPLVDDTDRWKKMFPGEHSDVTVYGEAYGAGIRSGGNYRPDMTMIVFDVLIDGWWLRRDNIHSVADGLGLDVVPDLGQYSLWSAWETLKSGVFTSAWDVLADDDTKGHYCPIEGIVGKPDVELKARDGERLIVKLKVADYERLVNCNE
jgi:hypothetical protein